MLERVLPGNLALERLLPENLVLERVLLENLALERVLRGNHASLIKFVTAPQNVAVISLESLLPENLALRSLVLRSLVLGNRNLVFKKSSIPRKNLLPSSPGYTMICDGDKCNWIKNN